MQINIKKIALSMILILAIIISTIVGITVANTTYNSVAEVNETKVVVVRDAENEKIVHIRLAMADGIDKEVTNNTTDSDARSAASIACFQIGLKVDVEENDKIEFKFNEDLEKMSTKKLIEYSYNEDENGDGVGDENLYIYYVGTQELNDAQSSDSLEIGTITYNTNKEASINITPIPGFSVAESMAQTETEFASVDSVEYIINRPEDEGPNLNTTNENVTGNNTNTENGGSGSTNSNGSTSGSESTNGNSSTGQNNKGDNNDSIIDRFVSSMKTGENRSIVGVLIALAILVVVAFILICLRSVNKGKKSKH